MTKIKLCGLSRQCDLQAANRLKPEYVGFVFAAKSRRYVSFEKAEQLKSLLCPGIKAVGVFVNESCETVARLLNRGVIDIAQLHSNEDEEYIQKLRALTDKQIIKAFTVESERDVVRAEKSMADFVLLDAGAGGGTRFDWSLLQNIKRPYFLAGGLDPSNVAQAVRKVKPYAVDVSSGIETNGVKDINKMAEFVTAVRKEEKI